MENAKVLDTLTKVVDSLDESIPFLEGKIKEFRHLSELADSSGKPEVGHTYNDMANMLGVMTEHANIIATLAELEKADHEAILDLFGFAKEIDDSALKKDEFKEKLEKLEKSQKTKFSKIPLKLDQLKLNFGIASATFKPKD